MSAQRRHPVPPREVDHHGGVLTLCALAAALALLFGGVLFWLMELMVTQALMAALMGRSTPEIVSFVLGAVTHAAVRAPYLVCAATLAAVLSLLGQALVPNPGARRELRRTVGQGALWGLCLMAVLIHLGLAGVGALGLFVVTGAQIVLAILTGRRPRAEGLAFAHAVLATALAGTLAFTGSETILSLMDCWSGRCSAPDATYATVYLALPIFSALLIASCVPSARRGRRTPGRAPLPGRVPGP
ncbi:hypothetical protein Sipo8835_27425 [Streptomyces ipomoeae]|uniref:Uncharacterized protein n=1 Tax=Streptomyces ipomoeae TaxID=103232 RepID=A0AAE8W0C5_9ACTN|nr:hypothetical protein [Streptomyces ipomoeae]TQE27259.1 hypothetical protein Sipo8835_27425 [Streptomyces ipomoeae]